MLSDSVKEHYLAENKYMVRVLYPSCTRVTNTKTALDLQMFLYVMSVREIQEQNVSVLA